jgi:hypothetical protein
MKDHLRATFVTKAHPNIPLPLIGLAFLAGELS